MQLNASVVGQLVSKLRSACPTGGRNLFYVLDKRKEANSRNVRKKATKCRDENSRNVPNKVL